MRGRRRRPCFPQELWNVCERVVEDLPRTNNSLEGWHRAFDRIVANLQTDYERSKQIMNYSLNKWAAGMALPPTKK